MLSSNDKHLVYSESMYGRRHGPAHMSSIRLDVGDWVVTNIPSDLDMKIVGTTIQKWLDGICSYEVPTSLTCNLDCKYCYITDKWLKNKPVKTDDIEKILNTAHTYLTGNKQHKTITPWGAEPFANLDALELTIDFAEKYGYKIGTSTNGTITSERAIAIMDKLIGKKILDGQLQVSLDGPANVQNHYRCTYNGGPSFDKVMEFLGIIKEIDTKYGNKIRSYHNCSTIFLGERTEQDYLDALYFFGNMENDLVFTRVMPMRVVNHIAYTAEYRDIFIRTMEKAVVVLDELSTRNNTYMEDFYISKSTRKERHYGCTHSFCSAMHTHIAIDLDGSMYLCHSPVTMPSLKPLFLFGNLFERTIDYRAWVRCLDMFSCKMVVMDICNKCVMGTEPGCSSLVCLDCPANYVAIDGLPMNYDPYRCEAVRHMLPIWKQYMIDTDRRMANVSDAAKEKSC